MIFEISKQEERRAKALYESYAKLIADLDTKLTLPPGFSRVECQKGM